MGGIDWIIAYFWTGFIFWLTLAVLRYKLFKRATIGGIIRGLIFGIALWPVGMVIVYLDV